MQNVDDEYLLFSSTLLFLKSAYVSLLTPLGSSGTKPSYLGVQKSPPSLALCPATNNCVSTSEEISDSNHYAPPW